MSDNVIQTQFDFILMNDHFSLVPWFESNDHFSLVPWFESSRGSPPVRGTRNGKYNLSCATNQGSAFY
jgi:hypothetical protein